MSLPAAKCATAWAEVKSETFEPATGAPYRAALAIQDILEGQAAMFS